MKALVIADATESGSTRFRYARQSARLLWWRCSGGRPCACARVVVRFALLLLCGAHDVDAQTLAGSGVAVDGWYVCGEQGGLLAPGRHNSPKLGIERRGIERERSCQLMPVEPTCVLDPNGGDHEVSWTGCARGGNGVVRRLTTRATTRAS